jgi:hypothetical protein
VLEVDADGVITHVGDSSSGATVQQELELGGKYAMPVSHALATPLPLCCS